MGGNVTVNPRNAREGHNEGAMVGNATEYTAGAESMR